MHGHEHSSQYSLQAQLCSQPEEAGCAALSNLLLLFLLSLLTHRAGMTDTS